MSEQISSTRIGVARRAGKTANLRVVPQPAPAAADDDGALMAAAADAGRNAYAPYSKFSVGAAVRTRSGRIHVGCNVENVSYPVGVCAERNAIAAAVAAEGPGMAIDTIAVSARNRGKPVPCAPCGACRQAISEFGPASRVLHRGQGLVLRCDPIGFLLPGAFSFEPGAEG